MTGCENNLIHMSQHVFHMWKANLSEIELIISAVQWLEVATIVQMSPIYCCNSIVVGRCWRQQSMVFRAPGNRYQFLQLQYLVNNIEVYGVQHAIKYNIHTRNQRCIFNHTLSNSLGLIGLTVCGRQWKHGRHLFKTLILHRVHRGFWWAPPMPLFCGRDRWTPTHQPVISGGQIYERWPSYNLCNTSM